MIRVIDWSVFNGRCSDNYEMISNELHAEFLDVFFKVFNACFPLTSVFSLMHSQIKYPWLTPFLIQCCKKSLTILNFIKKIIQQQKEQDRLHIETSLSRYSRQRRKRTFEINLLLIQLT